MWPFNRKETSKRKTNALEKIIVGLVIGGAIASIVGKTMLDKKRDEGGADEQNAPEKHPKKKK